MTRIALVTDSTCDLADAQRAQYVTAVVPLHVWLGGASYLDRVDFDSAHFYRLFRDAGQAAQSSQPSVGEFVNTYRALLEDYDSVVSVHISGHLSGAVQSAEIAADSVDSARVRVVDSRQVSVGLGLVVGLEKETTETAILSVSSTEGPIIVDSVPTSRMFKPYTAVGMLLPGVSSADAQVLIAFAPEETWDAWLAAPVQPRTENTITDPDRLRERWRTIRREGIAYDWGEWNAEAPAVGAPVFDQSGQVRAAITVVPAIERCSQEQMQGYAAAVKRTASELSTALGYRGN